MQKAIIDQALQKVINDRDKYVVTIYPLTKEGKLNKEIEPFDVPANYIAKQVEEILLAKGSESPVQWYGAGNGEELPEQYRNEEEV